MNRSGTHTPNQESLALTYWRIAMCLLEFANSRPRFFGTIMIEDIDRKCVWKTVISIYDVSMFCLYDREGDGRTRRCIFTLFC